MTSWIENDARNKVYPSSTNGTTHRFYLLVRDDLVRRARRATERGLCQELLQKRCNYPDSHPSKKQAHISACLQRIYRMGRTGVEPATHGFSVHHSARKCWFNKGLQAVFERKTRITTGIQVDVQVTDNSASTAH
jgi:hypothetical protein